MRFCLELSKYCCKFHLASSSSSSSSSFFNWCIRINTWILGLSSQYSWE